MCLSFSCVSVSLIMSVTPLNYCPFLSLTTVPVWVPPLSISIPLHLFSSPLCVHPPVELLARLLGTRVLLESMRCMKNFLANLQVMGEKDRGWPAVKIWGKQQVTVNAWHSYSYHLPPHYTKVCKAARCVWGWLWLLLRGENEVKSSFVGFAQYESPK